MRQLAFGVILAAVAPVPALAQTSWPVGMEREVDEGVYMKVLRVANGWRLWRIETKDSAECRAVKSARGRPDPIPVGVGAGFWRGTPSVLLYENYDRKIAFAWSGEHYGKVEVKTRLLGARFWDEQRGAWSPDLLPFDGKLLEVNVTSWEYPEILVGLADETAVMDLTGLAAMVDAVKACNAEERAKKG